MIRVTVELVPKGDEERARVLSQAVIINDGTSSDPGRGSYDYGLTRQSNTGADPGLWKTGRVNDFPRGTRNAWHLLKRVLDDAI